LVNLKVLGHLRDKGIDGRIILRYALKEIGFEDVDWTHLAQNMSSGRFS
jgi:hypothetical protein